MAQPENIILTGRSRRAIERMNAAKGIRIQMSGEADATTRKIARAYGKAWKVVRRTTKEMADHAAEQMHAGRGLSARDISRLDRVDRALHVLERQVRTLNDYTGVTVKGATNQTVEHTVDAVLATLATQTGVDRRFTKPAGAAMEGLILRSTGRIESTVRRLDAEQATVLKDSLLRGLVLGENPRETARHIMRETEGTFFGGLSRATNLARTEVADAHRYSTRLAYGESELVVGWKWLAQLSSRTCPACWSMHNTLHDKTEMQFGHQSCRCTMVPILADDLPEDHDLGDPEEIFWGLPREDQLAIMGPGRLKALEAGATFTDLTYLKHNGNWRPSQAVTRVADLSGLAELNVATFPGDVIDVPGLTNSSIMSFAFAQGGLTINALTGDQPTSGFVVARQGTSSVIDAREFFGAAGPTEVAAWLTRHGDLLDEPGAHMGMWYDTANGKVVLDVVQIMDDREAAIALGRAEDQIAIFDLDTFTEISTGGTGGYASALLPGNTWADGGTKKPSAADVGKSVTIRQDGEVFAGTIIRVSPSGSAVIKLPDGTEKVAWPDQIETVVGADGSVEQVRERLKQVAEIADRAETATGIPDVSFSGMSVKGAEETARSIEELLREWPGPDTTGMSVGDVGTAFAMTNTSFDNGPDRAQSDIVISEIYARDPSTWVKDMQGAEDRGHFHRGTADEPEDYTIDHEYGHVLSFNLFGHPGSMEGSKARAEMLADVLNALPMGGNFRSDDIDGINRALSQPFTHILLKQDLSGYATTSYEEMVAEGFAVYRDHGPGTSAVADAVMRQFVRRYRKKYGRTPDERNLEALFAGEKDQREILPPARIPGTPLHPDDVKPGTRVAFGEDIGEIVSARGGKMKVRFPDGSVKPVFADSVVYPPKGGRP